jgi:hypothetical protein
MLLARNHAKRFVAEILVRDSIVLQWITESPNRKVNAPLNQERKDLIARFPQELYSQKGPASFDVGHRICDHVGSGPHDGANNELPITPLALAIQVKSESLEICEHTACKYEDLPADLGRFHPPGQAVEDWKSKDLLKIAYELRGARLCEVHGRRSAPQISMVVECNQKSEMPESKPPNKMRNCCHVDKLS